MYGKRNVSTKPYVKCTKQGIEVKHGLNHVMFCGTMHAILIQTFMRYCENAYIQALRLWR